MRQFRFQRVAANPDAARSQFGDHRHHLAEFKLLPAQATLQAVNTGDRFDLRQHAVQRLDQIRVGRDDALQQADYALQVVFDAMVDFLHQGIALALQQRQTLRLGQLPVADVQHQIQQPGHLAGIVDDCRLVSAEIMQIAAGVG